MGEIQAEAELEAPEAGEEVVIEYEDERGEVRELAGRVEFNTIGSPGDHMFGIEKMRVHTGALRSSRSAVVQADGSVRVKPRYNANGRGHDGLATAVRR